MAKKLAPNKVPEFNNRVPTVHPGQYVRESILKPKNMSVVAAAKLVGVGRPALSNFLNGKASTTPDMASRIEVAFGVPAKQLLDMQAAFDAVQAQCRDAPANAIRYVAPFLGFKANDIEGWVDRSIAARARLSVFLRTLVNSTGGDFTKVDFPGNDDAERPGWDGYIEAVKSTSKIPSGISGWEFGTNKDINAKADSDFAKSVRASTKAERDQTTFVFVTPRNWANKANWLNKAKAKEQWKDVRVYDSSDLEQWLEQSIAGQVWFANETRRPSRGVRSLDSCWDKWANVADRPLVGSLFFPAIEDAKRTMNSRLFKEPKEPTVIMADSVEEALAFLAQLFSPAGGDELEKYRDRVMVFEEQGVLPILAQGNNEFIAVAVNRQIERELGPLAHLMHTIVIYPRNAAHISPHIVLEPLRHDTFRSSLEEMGYERDDVTKFSNESGRSLTVLRRRLANVPAVRSPEWAADYETAVSLIPFLFTGGWNASNVADQSALTALANVNSYELLERICQRLVSLNDAPLWSVGTYRGVVSKIDLLFAISGVLTVQDLQRYFEIAKRVLGEDDPILDLPDEERWAGAIHGKSREFSPALRGGISETLVLLAVHGNHLFQSRLGFDCENAVSRLVGELLTPLKTRILEANDRDLSAYAEAAPVTFLTILEDDLDSNSPEVFGLMRPGSNGIFGGCPRTGLLWALECLAWSSTTLHRVVLILAKLSEIEITDNWSNKPINSLESIFRAWMPQTTADNDTRLRTLNLLAEKFPKVAWKICISQIDTGHKAGHYSNKPVWRNDAHGFGEPFKTWGPVHAFVRQIVDMVLNWKGGHSREMLCDLIQNLHGLSEEHQASVWGLVKSWADSGASDADKAFVREKIRITVLSRRGVSRNSKPNAAILSASAKSSYQALEPSDVLNKNEWLFRQHWVEESADEIHGDDTDYRKREERIAKIRKEALREIHDARGIAGIIEFAEMGRAASLMGWLVADELLQEEDIPGFLLAALPHISCSQPWARNELLRGSLRALFDKGICQSVLEKVHKELTDEMFARLLLLAPFRRTIWQLVDTLDEECRDKYWKEAVPDRIHDANDEHEEAVKRLLLVRRPRAAFTYIHFSFESIRPELLFRLMSEMANDSNDKLGQYQIDQHYIEQAFVTLDKSPEFTLDQKASLEFVYIDALAQPWREREGYGIPNLERYVEVHPEMFIQAVVWSYRRNDGEDPEEWRVAADQVTHFAERGYKLLEGLSRVPGHNDLGELQAERLSVWINAVRDTCAGLGRLEVADICIGKLLSVAPSDSNGVWPCEAICQVMEGLHSKNIMRGAHLGLYNSRGVTCRGDGGNQERILAEQYRTWANALQYSYPFVASELLIGMANTYEHEASREDTDAGIKRRLR